MSDFDDLMHEMDGLICEELGRAASITINDESKSAHVIIDEDVSQFGEYGEVQGTINFISVPVEGVGVLKKGTRIESQGKAWLIDQLEDNDGSMARYSMKKV